MTENRFEEDFTTLYLTKNEIKDHMLWLASWRTPKVMLTYCEKLMSRMSSITYGVSVVLFNQPGLNFITEAITAAEFAKLRGAKDVRLMLDDQPDFQVRMVDVVENWELTEADIEGRQRGREYKESANKAMTGVSVVETDPVENWIARADQIKSVLGDRATKKANKNYPVGTRLLIYLNISEFGIRQKETEECMIDATSPAKNTFSEVWVLWKDKAYQLWVDGNPVGLY